MKLILKKDVANLGGSGEVVDVKPGYARNYLIPHGIAYEASAENIERLEEEQRLAEEAAKRDYLEARRRASQIEDKTLVFKAKAGEEGRLFGSVTNADIAQRLNDEGDLDFEVDKRNVENDPLKELGEHSVTIRLHSDVVLELPVIVEPED
ncbi:MAG: 50S ribosomal protein L9 [Gemmatimonadota bacterium]|jgi:large subunit ribosomal protein L9